METYINNNNSVFAVAKMFHSLSGDTISDRNHLFFANVMGEQQHKLPQVTICVWNFSATTAVAAAAEKTICVTAQEIFYEYANRLEPRKGKQTTELC